VVTVALLVDQRTAIRPDWPCVVTIAAPLPAVNDLRGNDGARPQVSRALSDRARGASFRPPRRRPVTGTGKGRSGQLSARPPGVTKPDPLSGYMAGNVGRAGCGAGRGVS